MNASGTNLKFKLANCLSSLLLATLFCPAVFCGEIDNAAYHGNLTKVKALIETNPDLVLSKDADGMTPLHWAAMKGRKDVIEFLLANKADINSKNKYGATPYDIAVANGQKKVEELLRADGAHEIATAPNSEEGQFRIELAKDSLRIQGKDYELPISTSELNKVFGPPARSVELGRDPISDEPRTFSVWDALGIYAQLRQSDKSYPAVSFRMARENGVSFYYTPKRFFRGEILVDGRRISEGLSENDARNMGFSQRVFPVRGRSGVPAPRFGLPTPSWDLDLGLVNANVFFSPDHGRLRFVTIREGSSPIGRQGKGFWNVEGAPKIVSGIERGCFLGTVHRDPGDREWEDELSIVGVWAMVTQNGRGGEHWWGFVVWKVTPKREPQKALAFDVESENIDPPGSNRPVIVLEGKYRLVPVGSPFENMSFQMK